jgi:hypothetical protein
LKERTPSRFLKKSPDGRVLHWTPYLAKRKDLIECDIDGTPLGLISKKSTGIRLSPPGKPAPVIHETVNEPTVETEPINEVTDEVTDDDDIDLKGLKRTEMVKRAIEVYGAEAEYIKANWSQKKIADEIEKLQAAKELRSE